MWNWNTSGSNGGTYGGIGSRRLGSSSQPGSFSHYCHINDATKVRQYIVSVFVGWYATDGYSANLPDFFSAFLQQNPHLLQQVGAGSSGLQDEAKPKDDTNPRPQESRSYHALLRTMPQLHHKPVNQLSVQLQVLKPVSHRMERIRIPVHGSKKQPCKPEVQSEFSLLYTR